MAAIAFIGLGNMGLPMAKNLLKAGHALTAFDLSKDQLAAAEAAGAKTAASVADAVKGAEVVVSMLPAGRHVTAVYTEAGGVIESAGDKTLLIDSSTIDVATARAVNEAAAAKGLAMVDAPVSGGVGGAEAGTLTFMVGGSEDAFDCAKSILEAMGKNVFHAGSAGNGQAAKICNNMLLAISMIGVGEAFVMAEKLGLDWQRFYDIASTASGQCWSLTSYCPVPGPLPTSPANRDYKPGFATSMMLKDLKLAQAAAQDFGAATPLGAQAAALYSLFEASGNGGDDFSSIINMLRGQRISAATQTKS